MSDNEIIPTCIGIGASGDPYYPSLTDVYPIYPVEWLTETGLPLTSIIPSEINFTIGVHCAAVTYTQIEDNLL